MTMTTINTQNHQIQEQSRPSSELNQVDNNQMQIQKKSDHYNNGTSVKN